MENKKVIILALLLSVSLFAIINGGILGFALEGTWEIYNLEYAGLRVRIEAPCQVDPGENITVNVRAEAPQRIYVEYIYIEIYGLRNETDKIALKNMTHLKNTFLTTPHEVDYIVTIHNDTSPGLTYGTIECEWEFMGAPEKIPSAGFVVTYVRSTQLEQLQAEYDELMANYTSLLANYTELDSKYAGELGGARNLMYVFVVTTIIAVGTVLFLILRRPKTFWS